MRTILALMVAAVALAPVAAQAATILDENPFEHDRQFAQSHLSPLHRQYCLQDFTRKVHLKAPLEATGPFSFNEYISRDVYQMLYWKEGVRGVAFTVPVRLRDPRRGEVATNLACFYAVRGNELVFQHSQQMPWHL